MVTNTYNMVGRLGGGSRGLWRQLELLKTSLVREKGPRTRDSEKHLPTNVDDYPPQVIFFKRRPGNVAEKQCWSKNQTDDSVTTLLLRMCTSSSSYCVGSVVGGNKMEPRGQQGRAHLSHSVHRRRGDGVSRLTWEHSRRQHLLSLQDCAPLNKEGYSRNNPHPPRRSVSRPRSRREADVTFGSLRERNA